MKQSRPLFRIALLAAMSAAFAPASRAADLHFEFVGSETTRCTLRPDCSPPVTVPWSGTLDVHVVDQGDGAYYELADKRPFLAFQVDSNRLQLDFPRSTTSPSSDCGTDQRSGYEVAGGALTKFDAYCSDSPDLFWVAIHWQQGQPGTIEYAWYEDYSYQEAGARPISAKAVLTPVVAAVPEPSTYALMAAGCMLLAAGNAHRRRRSGR